METLQKSAGFQPHPSAACGTGCFLQVPNKSKRALGFFFSLPSFRKRATCSFALRFWAAGMALMVFSPPGISWELKPGFSSAARYTWLPVFHQDSFVLGNNAPSPPRGFAALLAAERGG